LVHAADKIGTRGIVVHAISGQAKVIHLALGFDFSANEPVMHLQ
jgi:hypothetical protein